MGQIGNYESTVGSLRMASGLLVAIRSRKPFLGELNDEEMGKVLLPLETLRIATSGCLAVGLLACGAHPLNRHAISPTRSFWV